eukprot:TRINITY_DN5523_c0_g1_i1.p1 TRINITY_DN5523_c0_g1~~TRINITY_DN5523_c0_g1_i1.p1  ORF type:complete len:675 (+),score=63.85 TRINITY_DN5523_c0_g1_i1:1110-3134(+)
MFSTTEFSKYLDRVENKLFPKVRRRKVAVDQIVSESETQTTLEAESEIQVVGDIQTSDVGPEQEEEEIDNCQPSCNNQIFQKVLRRSPYYIFPPLLWLPKYDWRKNLLGDIFAGIGIACMLVPQSMAYSFLAGVPPITGLYTSFIPLLIFSLLTTSHHLSVGPDSVGSLLVGIAMQKPHHVETPQALGAIYAFIVGITLLCMGIFRFGFLDNVMSRPIMDGFVNAVAVNILISQAHGFLGIKADSNNEDAVDILKHLFEHITEIEWVTFEIGILSLLLLFLHTLVKKFFPNSIFLKLFLVNLVVVVVGIVLTVTLHLDAQGVQVLGTLPTGFQTPSAPDISVDSLQRNLSDGAVIGIMGFVQSILAAKIYATKYEYQVSPNRELVALGMCNLVGSFFWTYPAFASLTRTAVVDLLGGTSQIFSFVAAFLVLMTILFLSPLFYYLPRVVMNSILIKAAFTLFDYEGLVFFIKIRAWFDIGMMLVTFFVTVFLGTDIGLFLGIGISLLLVIRHTTAPHVCLLGKTEDNKFRDVSTDKRADLIPGIIILRVDEGIYFANVEQIKHVFKRAEHFGQVHAHPTDHRKSKGQLKAIIVYSKNIYEIDASAVRTVWEIIQNYKKANVFVGFVKLSHKYRDIFRKAGITEGLDFESIQESIDYVSQDADGDVEPTETDLWLQ